MKKTSLLITGLLVLIAVFAYLYFSGSISFFAQSASFNLSNQKLIVTDDEGNLQFIPTENIDSAINTTVKSLDDSMTPIINEKLGSAAASATYMPIVKAYSTFQPMGDYIPYDSQFRLSTQWATSGTNSGKGGWWARYYNGKMGWNAWDDIKKMPDADKAYWTINKIPSSS